MEAERAERIARQVDELATSSGLGFLLAQVTVDGILGGRLDPDSPGFDEELRGRAYELLLRTAGSEEGPAEGAPYAALSEALALAPEPGIPVGEVWQAIAEALDGEQPAGIEQQLQALQHFRRFVIEEHHGGTAVYRWFHPGLRDALRERVGGYESERSRRALQALLELRTQLTEDWREPERAGWFLLESLPKMAALSGDNDLLRAAIADAPEAVARALVLALLAAADAERALGHTDAAHRLNQTALLICLPREDGAYALALVGQAESATLDFDLWREGRDMSRGALEITERLLEESPGRYDLLEVSVRATATLARALGSGAFDAEDGLHYVGEALRQIAGAASTAQPSLAPAVADLLQAYADSLGSVTTPMVRAETAAAAARIRGQMVEAGREDLRLELAESLGLSSLAREELGDDHGAEAFRRSLLPLLAVAPTPARWILPLTWMVSELVRSLVYHGYEREALELLDRAVEGFAPTVELAQESDGYRLGLAVMLGLRAAVLSAHGRTEEALGNAEEGFEVAAGHPEPESATTGLLGESLVGRLLEVDRPQEALSHLDSLPDSAGSLRALALGAAARQRGKWGEAIFSLGDALEQLDPGQATTVSKRDLTEFVTFARELRAGRELARAHEQAGEPGAADKARQYAATVFVRRQAGSPWRLSHLEPELLAEMSPFLRTAAEREIGDLMRPTWLNTLKAREGGVERFAYIAPTEWGLAEDVEIEIPPAPSFEPRIAKLEEPDWPVKEVAVIEAKLAEGLRAARREAGSAGS